jgi:hypothetical protein
MRGTAISNWVIVQSPKLVQARSNEARATINFLLLYLYTLHLQCWSKLPVLINYIYSRNIFLIQKGALKEDLRTGFSILTIADFDLIFLIVLTKSCKIGSVHQFCYESRTISY